LNIRQATIHDLPELQQLFIGTIKTVCTADYNSEQTEVWASGIENMDRWQQVLLEQVVWVATNEEKITGFCTLANGSYIDLFYVHKDHQRQGIALQLYTRIEQEAKRRNQTELTSNVSKTAKKFFEKMGFEVVTEQTVTIKGVDLTN
jgi:putative acetyltransferase